MSKEKFLIQSRKQKIQESIKEAYDILSRALPEIEEEFGEGGLYVADSALRHVQALGTTCGMDATDLV